MNFSTRQQRPTLVPHCSRLHRRLPHIWALVLLLCAADLSAQKARDEEDASGNAPQSNEFSAQVRVGGVYDTNVSVDELNASTGQSDYAAVLQGQLEYQWAFAQKTKFSLSYDVSQSFYAEFSNLDRQSHILSGDLRRKVGDTDVGISYHYVDARLDGDDFLNIQRTSPYASMFLSKKVFARLAYVYIDKDIIDRSDRDADSSAGELDVYWFRQGLRSYFNFGYRYKDEDANAARFDFKSNSFKLRYVQRFALLGRLAKLEMAWRYEDRDYSSPTPSISEDRGDERNRWDIDLEIPVLESASLVFFYAYNNYNSNLPSADYGQHLAGSEFVYRW